MTNAEKTRPAMESLAAARRGTSTPEAGALSGFSAEERKLIFESRKILELPELDICAQACRVPVAVGHYENVWVELEQREQFQVEHRVPPEGRTSARMVQTLHCR